MSTIVEILRTKADGRLFHREGQELEFKEQFNFAGLAEYLRDFAAFANNRGGLLVFGVSDSPRKPTGMSPKAAEQFERLDPQRLTGHILEMFSPAIEWEQHTFEFDQKLFGVFEVQEAKCKPVIARKDEGKQQTIRNGEIYFRYAGRTQKIRFTELENIVNRRIAQINRHWQDLVQKIGEAGPENAAILDTERSVIEKQDAQILVVDESLAEKLRFIRAGMFDEVDGEPTLKLVGDVVPVNRIEVVRRVRENLTREYPLSAMELAQEVRRAYPKGRTNRIWNVIRENGLKDNPDYSVYNFRNKKQEDEYKQTGVLPVSTPSIYKESAVDLIVGILRTEDGGS